MKSRALTIRVSRRKWSEEKNVEMSVQWESIDDSKFSLMFVCFCNGDIRIYYELIFFSQFVRLILHSENYRFCHKLSITTLNRPATISLLWLFTFVWIHGEGKLTLLLFYGHCWLGDVLSLDCVGTEWNVRFDIAEGWKSGTYMCAFGAFSACDTYKFPSRWPAVRKCIAFIHKIEYFFSWKLQRD